MLADLFGPTGTLGQAWLFATPVGATIGFLVIEAGQRFARRWEDRHTPSAESSRQE